jgi:DNA-directed RNA polymerase subunit L
MELNVVKKDEKSLLIECRGETSTLTEALREHLWNVKGVVESAEIKEHPYLAEPKIFVKVSQGSPAEALEKAVENILEEVEKFEKAFKEELKH